MLDSALTKRPNKDNRKFTTDEKLNFSRSRIVQFRLFEISKLKSDPCKSPQSCRWKLRRNDSTITCYKLKQQTYENYAVGFVRGRRVFASGELNEFDEGKNSRGKAKKKGGARSIRRWRFILRTRQARRERNVRLTEFNFLSLEGKRNETTGFSRRCRSPSREGKRVPELRRETFSNGTINMEIGRP